VALYIATIKKQYVSALLDESPWVNTYHVTAADEDGAISIANGIVDIEKAVHWSDIAFTKLSVRQDSELAGSGKSVGLSGLGERDATGESFLPSFCTARVTFTDGIARPDQKYLRLNINETEQNNGNFETTFLDFLQDNYVAPLMGLVGLVSSDGTTYTSGVVNSVVQMRQRSWSRRFRPGFKRGWVPTS